MVFMLSFLISVHIHDVSINELISMFMNVLMNVYGLFNVNVIFFLLNRFHIEY